MICIYLLLNIPRSAAADVSPRAANEGDGRDNDPPPCLAVFFVFISFNYQDQRSANTQTATSLAAEMLFLIIVILPRRTIERSGRKCLQVHLYTHTHTHQTQKHDEILRKKLFKSGHILFTTEYSDVHARFGMHSSFSHTQQSCMQRMSMTPFST